MVPTNVWQFLTYDPWGINIFSFCILVPLIQEFIVVVIKRKRPHPSFLIFATIALIFTSTIYTQGRPLEALETNPTGALPVAGISLIWLVSCSWTIITHNKH